LIISLYYSTAYSHPLPTHKIDKKIFINERNRIKDMGINNFFLDQIDKWIIPQFTKYRHIKENSKLSSFHKYENLVKNPKKIIFEITKKMNISITEKIIDNLAEDFKRPFKNKTKVKSKNLFVHTRSGNSRQFEYELNKDVLKTGNDKMIKTLEYWDFEI
jgi:endo-alpha-1,4-polygalactosaminidase (GH114 family)